MSSMAHGRKRFFTLIVILRYFGFISLKALGALELTLPSRVKCTLPMFYVVVLLYNLKEIASLAVLILAIRPVIE